MKVPSMQIEQVTFFYYTAERVQYQAVITYNLPAQCWCWYVYKSGKSISAPVKELRTHQFKTDTRARQVIRRVLQTING